MLDTMYNRNELYTMYNRNEGIMEITIKLITGTIFGISAAYLYPLLEKVIRVILKGIL